jgi:hypothetical protein
MKKPKHPSIWEEDESDSAEEGGSPMDHILDDEEIIDLEDIVELPADEQEQEEPLNVDVEVLDLDSGMDFDDMESPGGAGKKGRAGRAEKKGRARGAKDLPDSGLMPDMDLLEKDPDEALLDFSFPDENEERSGKDDLDLLSEDGDDISVDFVLPDEEESDKDSKKEEDLLLGDLDEELIDFSFPEEGKEEELKDDLVSKREARVKGFLKKEAEQGDQGMAGALAEPSDASDVALERFVSQIEIRLVESLREIVEARLPEVVRSVLREEINKIKKEAE